jgi:capsular exopolysaccharide synthesis family protein
VEKLEIYKSDNYILNDAFDQSVMKLHILKQQNGYKSFLVVGCEAGTGATTVAINLAAALAGSGCKTVLIDGDMRKNNSYKRLNENVTHGLSDYLMGKAKMDQIIYETTTQNLSYVPCGELIDNPVRLLCSPQMNSAKNEFTELFEYVIYDMPAVNAAMDSGVVAVNADAVILVTTIGETSKRSLIDAANTLVEEKANLIGVIVNKTDMAQYASYRKDYDYFENEKYANATHIKKQKKVKRRKNVKRRKREMS